MKQALTETKITKILIANRGEIACRIIKTAKQLGIKTVAVYSEADADAPHVALADQAVLIGPATVSASYLNMDNIFAATKASGADAIHPGYGFLSENAEFAKACKHQGITFIGPSPDAIQLMGCKRQSKIAMLESGVPCIPGYQQEDQSLPQLVAAAQDIGFPIMLKASAGGGGRGMRLVDDASLLEESIRSAKSEALNAFGSDQLIIEKAVIAPRHIEIQIFADQQGNTIYLGERDCSIQRRHQKVVEEAPAPGMTEELRASMGQAAVNAAKSCNYVGAGTVEFLLDKDNNFYFLEMNTRLQVEHPVTEIVTGLDLVEMQIRVAEGHPLPIQQEEINLNGHAIEVRLYAEDPSNHFYPQTGQVEYWQAAEGEGIRIDSGIETGQVISPFYDPMLAKLIGYGKTRQEAIQKVQQAIRESHLIGVKNNRAFLGAILKNPVFIEGKATTAFISEDFSQDNSLQEQAPSAEALAMAAFVLSGQSSWSTTSLGPKPCLIGSDQLADNTLHKVSLIQQKDNSGQSSFKAQVDGYSFDLELISEQLQGEIEVAQIKLNEDTFQISFWDQQIGRINPQRQLYLAHNDNYYLFKDMTLSPAQSSDNESSDDVKASMDGLIIECSVKPGDTVSKGDPIVILEAMKMEHSLCAPRDGIVDQVLITSGQQVSARALLVQLESE